MQIYKTFRQRLNAQSLPELGSIQVNRLCVFSAIIALDKWVEFYDRYAATFPKNCREAAKRLKKEVEEKGIPKFRDQVVGHVWSKDENRPLTPTEVEARFLRISPGGTDEFMRWVCDDGVAARGSSAASVVESVRDSLRVENDFSNSDLDG
jgi:hypothetical protein